MSALGSVLSTAKEALAAQQYGLSVTGNNIANVNNPNYSRQNVEQVNNESVTYSGFLIGSGVSVSQVQQSVDQLLENRLTDEKSSLASSEQADSYMTIVTDYFDESSENSLSNLLTDFWNSWNDLSNDPLDSSQRITALENADQLSDRFNITTTYLDQVSTDLTSELGNAVYKINSLTSELAGLNKEIMSQEFNYKTDNDKRDHRNALIDELGGLIDLDTIEQSSGATLITIANGLPIVSNAQSHELVFKDKEIAWTNSANEVIEISDKISGGQINGWLQLRDEIIPEYKAEINELAKETIWALNYQHSQGVGLNYFSDTITGNYQVDQSKFLSSFSFGNKIDYSKDFTIWTKDDTTADTQYTKSQIDMGISEAKTSNFQGTSPEAQEGIYKFTVVEGASLGDKKVIETDGPSLAQIAGSTVDAANALNTVLSDQNLSIYGASVGTQVIEIKDAGGDAKRSASSIAQTLNQIDGIDSYSSENKVNFDISNIKEAKNDDTIAFSIYVDGLVHEESFTVDSAKGSIEDQFEDAFLAAAKSINDSNTDKDLVLTYDGENLFNLKSESGQTIGLENFDITYNTAPTTDDYITFSGSGSSLDVYEESATGTNKAAVITGTITTLVDPAITVSSSVGGEGGLFAEENATIGSAIMTLGGEDGFQNFSPGETISFEVDGIAVSYDIGTATTDDLEFAQGLETALNDALTVPFPDDPQYSIIQTGYGVSILKKKDLEDPIAITNFTESGEVDADGNNAQLRIQTGSGNNTDSPDNDLLQSGNEYRNFASSSLYKEDGVIMWEKLDSDGLSTGKQGLIKVEDQGTVTIEEEDVSTLSFDISAGSLVAGNTLSVNMDEAGNPDPLEFTIVGTGNSQSDIYHFEVVSGGKVGTLPAQGEEPIVIRWKNSLESGSFELEGHDPPLTPRVSVEVDLDGMKLRFTDGTVFANDVFTITTDSAGIPVSTNASGDRTGDLLSDWHWTLDSFTDQFNKSAAGMTASVTHENRLEFTASQNYNVITNKNYSGSNGFTADNISIEVKNRAGINFQAQDLQFSRDIAGAWTINNDPTGGDAYFIPLGADDDMLSVDFTGDGLADLEISFNDKPTGQGFVEFDFEKHTDDDISFAFSDNASSSSGLLAAAGINTFFSGDSAVDIDLNIMLSNTNYITAAQINSDTGEISHGDNTNALAMADLQFQSYSMKQWTFVRGSDAVSSINDSTLDGYYNTMIGSLGSDSRAIKSSREFSEIMVSYMSEERDAVSAVSLDEEMIKLMKYQNAFAAASKLVSVADEMLNTLIGMR